MQPAKPVARSPSPAVPPRRRLVQVGALAAATLLVGQPRRSAAAALQGTLAYGSTGYTWAVPFVAEVGGYWQQQGLALKSLEFPTGRDAMQALLAGSANFSTTTDTPLVLAVLRGIKPRVLVNFSRYSYDMKIVAGERSGIDPDVPASLKGRKVGTPAGTSGQYALARYLAFAGLQRGDVTEVHLAPGDLIGALSRGDIDAFSWTAQAAQAALRQTGGKARLLRQDGYETFFRSHQLLLVNDATFEKQQPLVDAVVRALLEAEQRIAADPAWPELISPRLRISADEIRQATTSVFEFQSRFDEAFLDDLVTHARWAIEAGLSKAPDGDLRALFRSVLVEAPLKAVAPGRVTLS